MGTKTKKKEKKFSDSPVQYTGWVGMTTPAKDLRPD